MELTLTDQDLVILEGGNVRPGLGSQTHLPIFKDTNGIEYVFKNRFVPTKVSDIGGNTRREKVSR